jgi:FtsX-like permease family protein
MARRASRFLVAGMFLLAGCTTNDAGAETVTSEMAASSFCLHAPFLGLPPSSVLLGDSPIASSPPAGFVDRVASALRGDVLLFRLAGEGDRANELEAYIEAVDDRLKETHVDLQVFLEDGTSEQDKAEIEKALTSDERVREATFISRAEAFERFKKIFRDEPSLIENVDVSSLPESFDVVLENPSQSESVRATAEALHGVDEVKVSGPGVDLPTPPSSLTEACEPLSSFFGLD